MRVVENARKVLVDFALGGTLQILNDVWQKLESPFQLSQMGFETSFISAEARKRLRMLEGQQEVEARYCQPAMKTVTMGDLNAVGAVQRGHVAKLKAGGALREAYDICKRGAAPEEQPALWPDAPL